MAGKASFSQQQYFVYIQSDDKQPFYVLLNGKTYSSSEYGHVILSKLADSTHHISIGFPKKVYPEQIFTININKKDAGYQLKNLGEKGWSLFNLQTLNLIMSGSTASLEKKNPDFSGVKKTDEFSVLLANVVNDSSILYSSTVIQQKPPVKTEEKSVAVIDQKKIHYPPHSMYPTPSQKKSIASTAPPVVPPPTQQPTTGSPAKDVSATVIPTTVAAIPITGSVKDETANKQVQPITRVDSNAKKNGEVVKLQETSAGNYLTITFLSRMDQHTDTIQISIPIEKIEEKQIAVVPVTPVKDTVEKKSVTQNDQPVTIATVVTKTDNTQAKKVNTVPPINDCKNYATDGDVDKLRVKILALKTNAEKIDAAKKVYKTKCFSVRQVRALSELFKTDEERYLFFEASYKSVSDAYNFKELGNLINEETYRNRFNEL